MVEESEVYSSRKEGVYFEAKKSKGRLTDDFWPTYSAFANTFGGTIVLGLEEDPNDKKKLIPVGIKDTDKIIKDLWDQINNPQKASVNILTDNDIRVVKEDGNDLIVITVPRAERRKRPVFVNSSLNNGTYRRNGEGDYHCSLSEISEMMRDASNDPPDSLLCTKVLLKDLDSRSIDAYRQMLNNRNPQHPWNKLPSDEFLRVLGAAEKDENGNMVPTIAGLMMFGFDYSIRREVPNYMLDYFRYVSSNQDWMDRITTDSGEWSGNLFEFYNMVSVRLQLENDRPFELNGDIRNDESGILKAEREAVMNGIAHADYGVPGGVRIELRPDKLVVRNPGTFRIPISTAEAGGVSDPRNPNVMKMFMLIGFVERAGSGISRMRDACRSMGVAMPVIEETMEPLAVTVTMGINPTATDQVPKNSYTDILQYLRMNPDAMLEDMSKMFGLSVSTMSRRISKLKKDGAIKREGPGRGKWVVNTDMDQ